MTTGAFYGYFESKEAVFAALVDEPYRVVLSGYRKVLAKTSTPCPKNEQPENHGARFRLASAAGDGLYVGA